jgi:uncharacterized membrane protein YhaH (DUF805 family)
MAEAGRSEPQPVAAGGTIHLLFSYRGRIEPLKYWIGLVAALAAAIVALGLGGQAMSPTGGDSAVLLGFPLLVLFIWVHSAVTIKRLRDAGLAAWAYLLFIAIPLIAIAAAVEFIEQAWVLILVALIALLAVPGLIRSKPNADVDIPSSRDLLLRNAGAAPP